MSIRRAGKGGEIGELVDPVQVGKNIKQRVLNARRV